MANWLVVLALSLGTTAIAHAQSGQPLPAVTVAPAELQTLQDSVSFSGRLHAAQQVALRARVTGFIENVAFTEGSKVAAGTVLYDIEDDAYAAALKNIEGQIVSAQAERDLAELERDRQAELVARQASPQRALDQAEAALKQAEGALITLNAEKRSAELNLSYTKITAPFEGTVGLTNFDIGALVGPDSGALVTLTRDDPIYAEFNVPTRVLLNIQADIAAGKLSENASFALTLANGTRYEQPGKLNYVDSEVAEGTDTILVRAVFDNPGSKLRDGEFVVVQIQSTDDTQVLTIPAQAISRNLAGNFVMQVAEDGTVTQQIVDTGATVGGRVAIRAGLQPGDMVIIEGLNKVRPGIKVNAATAAVDPAETDEG